MVEQCSNHDQVLLKDAVSADAKKILLKVGESKSDQLHLINGAGKN